MLSNITTYFKTLYSVVKSNPTYLCKLLKAKQALLFLLLPFFLSLTLVPDRIFAQTDIDGPIVPEILGDKYYDALEYLERNTWIFDTLIKANISPELAYAVVFPGLTQYSALKDIMETSGMKTLYVQSGRKYSKYRVGRFQMSPSFAELVERNATRYKLSDFKFKITNNPKARSERSRRLDSPSWQVEYLILYIRIMDKRFSHLKWKSPEDKVRFYATAFNVGFTKNERTIKYMMHKRTFLRKTKEVKGKLRHGDIAAWFYKNDGHRFKSAISILPPTESEAKEDEK